MKLLGAMLLGWTMLVFAPAARGQSDVTVTWDYATADGLPDGVAIGPMGAAELRLVPCTLPAVPPMPGTMPAYKVTVDLTPAPGWGVNAVNGYVVIQYLSVAGGGSWPVTSFGVYAVVGVSTGGPIHWEMGPWQMPGSTIVQAYFAATGVGSSQWGGVTIPYLYSVPVIMTSLE